MDRVNEKRKSFEKQGQYTEQNQNRNARIDPKESVRNINADEITSPSKTTVLHSWCQA